MTARMYNVIFFLKSYVRNKMGNNIKITEAFDDGSEHPNTLHVEGRAVRVTYPTDNSATNLRSISQLAICANADYVAHKCEFISSRNYTMMELKIWITIEWYFYGCSHFIQRKEYWIRLYNTNVGKYFLYDLIIQIHSTCEFNHITSIKSFDFYILYSTIPHDKLKSRLASIIRNYFIFKNGYCRCKYVVWCIL